MPLSNSNPPSWSSSNNNTMAGTCFSGFNEVNFLQILTGLSQSSYDFEPDSDDEVLLMLDIFATDGVFFCVKYQVVTNYWVMDRLCS